MKKPLKNFLIWIGSGLVLLVFLVTINQLHQVYITLSAFHPILGRVVTILLATVFAGIFFVPLFGFLKLRKPLTLPEENDQDGFIEYLQELKKRLVKNKHIVESGYAFEEKQNIREQIEGALEILNIKAEKVIHEAASTVFITTAVSQNGVLDGFFVLSSLSRLVWKISHIYNQKPTSAEIVNLYLNVAATVLMAREIEDLALLDEQLEPVISSLIGGTLSTLVPGTTAIANLLINSVIEGSANAFLTIRVGAMTRQYSAAVTQVDKRKLRRSATIEACRMLGKVVQQNSAAIVRAFASASKRATVDRTMNTIKGGALKTRYFIKSRFYR